MNFTRRNSRLGAVALGAAIVGGAAAATIAANPAGAAGIVSAVTTVSCSVTGSNWCISGNNSSSGIGVIGTSKSGTGLRGTSTSQYGLKATSGSGTAILAQTTSGSTAITAIGSSSSTGYGVKASAGDIGLYGTSSLNGGAGVYGTMTSGAVGDGISGNVSDGAGVQGSAGSGYGVYGSSTTGTAGGFFSNAGPGIVATTGGAGSIALYAKNSNGRGADVQGADIGIVGRAPTLGYPLALNDTDDGNGVFNVDGKGDVFYKGTLNHVSATTRGETVRSFSPNSTQPTVEDTGTAQLVGGAAAVRLDPAFAASIDPSSAYRVFVTPGGDTNGLYVAAKTASGFIVREIHGGRSTLPFDYRIVATALGASAEHMAFLSPAAARALAPPVPLPVVKAPKIPARLPTPAVAPATP
jgi:hypothetical protein